MLPRLYFRYDNALSICHLGRTVAGKELGTATRGAISHGFDSEVIRGALKGYQSPS
jgi:hypothetical protein